MWWLECLVMETVRDIIDWAYMTDDRFPPWDCFCAHLDRLLTRANELLDWDQAGDELAALRSVRRSRSAVLLLMLPRPFPQMINSENSRHRSSSAEQLSRIAPKKNLRRNA